MSMTIWNPHQEIENMLSRYSKAMGRDISSSDFDANMELAEWTPTVDVEEDKENYTIRADLPGVAKKDIEVCLDKGVLSITGDKQTVKETGKDTKQHRTERFYGSFARRFALPTAIKENELDATFKDGVLTLIIPKAEEVKPKSIDIKVK